MYFFTKRAVVTLFCDTSYDLSGNKWAFATLQGTAPPRAGPGCASVGRAGVAWRRPCRRPPPPGGGSESWALLRRVGGVRCCHRGPLQGNSMGQSQCCMVQYFTTLKCKYLMRVTPVNVYMRVRKLSAAVGGLSLKLFFSIFKILQ